MPFYPNPYIYATPESADSLTTPNFPYLALYNKPVTFEVVTNVGNEYPRGYQFGSGWYLGTVGEPPYSDSNAFVSTNFAESVTVNGIPATLNTSPNGIYYWDLPENIPIPGPIQTVVITPNAGLLSSGDLLWVPDSGAAPIYASGGLALIAAHLVSYFLNYLGEASSALYEQSNVCKDCDCMHQD